MRRAVRCVASFLQHAARGVAWLLVFLLSPELALRLAGCSKEAVMPTAELPDTQRKAHALRAMQHFATTMRTEEAFYLRFQRLPAASLTALKIYYDRRNPWYIYRQVCAFWRVQGAHRSRATRLLRRAWDAMPSETA